jgi:hypothetical protein
VSDDVFPIAAAIGQRHNRPVYAFPGDVLATLDDVP